MNAIRSSDSLSYANILPLPARFPATPGRPVPAPAPRGLKAIRLLRRESELAETICFAALWLTGLVAIVICLS